MAHKRTHAALNASRYVEVGPEQAPLAFRLRLPEDASTVPIVMLHGLGGDERSMWSLESALPRAGMLVAPRGPHKQRQGGYAWNPVIKAWPPLVSEFEPAISLLADLLGYLVQNYEFQRDRMILMGFSNGTAMSFAASMSPLSNAPAGIIAISGHLPEGDLASLSEIPIYWGHGLKDTFIPIDVARADVDRLLKKDVSVTYCEADVGHKLGAQCLTDLRACLQTEISAPEPGAT